MPRSPEAPTSIFGITGNHKWPGDLYAMKTRELLLSKLIFIRNKTAKKESKHRKLVFLLLFLKRKKKKEKRKNNLHV